jgi:fused signal recognition particle receptor
MWCEYYLKIITRIENRVADKYVGTDELNQILRDEIAAYYQKLTQVNLL